MMAKIDAHHEGMMACLGKAEATDLEANPEKMQSEAMHREVPKEEAAAKSSGALKKPHRGRQVAAGRCGQPEGRTRGNCGSRKKLAAAGRKRPAVQEWHGARYTSSERIKLGSKLPEEPGKNERTRRDCGRTRNAKLE
jgi:hypothetical protein